MNHPINTLNTVNIVFRADRDFAEQALALIREEFGSRWLEKYIADFRRTDRWNWHPIPKAWLAADLAFRRGDKVHQNLNAFFYVLYVAHVLELAKEIPNYAENIRSRLTSTYYESVLYEALVAVHAQEYGHQAEFISTASQSGRTPDIRLHTAKGIVALECKSKDDYKPAGNDVRLRLALAQELNQRITRTRFFIDKAVTVGVLGFDAFRPSDMPKVLELVMSFIREGRQGVFVRRGENVAFDITWSAPAIVAGGRPEVAVFVESVQAHRLGSVVRSLNDARGQLKEDCPGVAYIHLDVRNVADPHIPKYVNLVGAAMESCFTPEVNTGISAVVLTSETRLFMAMDGADDGPPHYFSHIFGTSVARNPHAEANSVLPAGLALPLTYPHPKADKALNIETQWHIQTPG